MRECQICTQPIEHLQLVTSFQTPTHFLYGHFLCVCEELGVEVTMHAMSRGLLPRLFEDDLVEGRLKTTVMAHAGVNPQRFNTVYEVIRS